MSKNIRTDIRREEKLQEEKKIDSQQEALKAARQGYYVGVPGYTSVVPAKKPVVVPPYFVTHPEDTVAIVPASQSPFQSAVVKAGGQIVSTPIQTSIVDFVCNSLADQAPFGKAIVKSLCISAANKLISSGKAVTVQSLKNLVNSAMSRMKGGKSRNAAPARRPSSQPQLAYSGASYGGRNAVVSAPAARSFRQMGTGKPRISSGKKGLVISHSEMIGSLISSGTTLTYRQIDYVVNPGKFATFPWLSTLAGNFDKYVIRSLLFKLVSNQPTSTGGRIGIGFDYDSTDPGPADRVEFFSLTHHNECSPWDSVSLKIPTDAKERFINSHTVTDSKLIDLGQVIVMSDQIVATSSNLADILVEYTVELIEPQQAVYSSMNASGAPTYSTWPTLTATGPVIGSVVSSTSTTTGEWVVPQGYYVANYFAFDNGAAAANAALAVSGGVGWGTVATNGAATVAQALAVFHITSDAGRFRIIAGNNLSVYENVTLFLTRVSATLYVAATTTTAGYVALTVY